MTSSFLRLFLLPAAESGGPGSAPGTSRDRVPEAPPRETRPRPGPAGVGWPKNRTGVIRTEGGKKEDEGSHPPPTFASSVPMSEWGAGGQALAPGLPALPSEAPEVHSRVLFEESVPVHVKQPEREEQREELQVRISLTSTRRGNHVATTRVLRVQVTNEANPFFLHSLEVDEEGFQALKVDQSILVDFGDFPARIIELLEACIAARGSANPKFLVVLSIQSERESTVGIIETNRFKHLCHISLGFQPGTDATIKGYLAERLLEKRAAFAALEDRFAQGQEGLAEANTRIEELSGQLSHERQLRLKEQAESDGKQKDLLAEAREKALAELEEVRAKLEAEKAAVDSQHRAQNEEISARNSKLDTEARGLLDQKYALEARVSELSAKDASAGKELVALREEVEQLRESNRTFGTERHEMEQKYNEAMIKGSAREAQLAEKDQQLKGLQQQLGALEDNTGALKSSLAELKDSKGHAEERAALSADEVKKGNQIIDKLQGELKNLKAKGKLKVAVIAQQESLLAERQAILDNTMKDNHHLKAERASAQAAAEALEAKLAEHREKLEESQKTMQQNEQMIQWLNSQVNDAQIGRLGGASRYSFRPTFQAGAAAGPQPPVNA